MAVVNHPNPPDNGYGGVWLDGDGNVDWDAYSLENPECTCCMTESSMCSCPTHGYDAPEI